MSLLWYGISIKGTGGIMPVISGKYQTYPVGAVEFMTNNFGKLAVAYNYKTFDDISSYSRGLKIR